MTCAPASCRCPRSREGGPPSGKHLQLFISHNMGCQYYVGRYDSGQQVFLPEGHGRHELGGQHLLRPPRR